MPGFDGTGPMSAGPMTGRGMGPCGGGYGRYTGYGRRGYNRGGGFGRMWGPFWRQTTEVSDKDKLGYLQSEAKVLKEELKAVEDELGKLKK